MYDLESQIIAASQLTMEQIVVSPSILSWNPHDYVYNPDFDLGIREKWLPKYPVVSATVIESKSRIRQVQLMMMTMMTKPAFGKAWEEGAYS